MAGYNRIIMVGNLTRDPDYKQLASGQGVCRLGIAANRQFRNRQTGDMIQEVCYVDIDVWGAQAESCKQYLQKGRPILVEGRLRFATWEDQDGNTRSKHSIVADRVVFLGSGASAETGDQPSNGAATRSSGQDDAFAKLEEIKKKAEAQSAAEDKKSAKKPEDGAVKIEDEPPFQDDLPF